jgi:CHAD domain-containing protein
MPSPAIQFARHATALKEAVDDVLSKPKAEPVHVLRSTLRRITAELRLLAESPKTTRRVARFIHLSRPIIKTAGRVRDLDVHLDLLQNLPRPLKPEADKLERHLQKRRRRGFTRLRNLLEDDHSALLKSLAKLQSIAPTTPSPGRALANETLLRAVATFDPHRADQLHELRKAARDARYLAESALRSTEKNSPAAHEAAHYRQIQQDVGAWHDYLTLAGAARKYLSSSSPLPPAIDRLRNRHHRSALKTIKSAAPRN